MSPEKSPESSVVQEQRVTISNKHGENLVGFLHQTCSKNLVILCHGFRATKDDSILVDLASALTREGVSTFRFDFAGNGESDGQFQYGNYRREADDLRSVVSYFIEQNYNIIGLVGHSKGEFEYRVTEESLKDRLSTDTLLSSRSISKDCRVLTIHGAKDEIVPVGDALMFAANIPNHELHIIVEANHRYTGHEKELKILVLDFIKSQPHFSSSLRPKL